MTRPFGAAAITVSVERAVEPSSHAFTIAPDDGSTEKQNPGTVALVSSSRTVIRSVARSLAEADGEAEALAEADGEVLTLAEDDGDVLADGDVLELAESDGDVEALADGEAETLAEADALVDADGEAEASGVLKTVIVPGPPTSAPRLMEALTWPLTGGAKPVGGTGSLSVTLRVIWLSTC